jgi:2-polyprenyl-3-methyl-5-hydroxy-6-metoxy-1,4-benzoquinol methylase
MNTLSATPDLDLASPSRKTYQLTRCNLCGGSDQEHYASLRDEACGTPGEFDYVRCLGCGLVFQNPRLPLEDVLTRYPADYVTNGMRINVPGRDWSGRFFEKMVLRGETQRVDEIAKRHPIDQGTRMLDIGCGNATFLYAARQSRGADVTGVEVSEECCRYARERLGLELMGVPFEDAEFDAPFDVVTMWHYLEHEYDALAALARCRLLLNDGGLLVVQVPNVGSLGARVFGRKWNGWDAPRHMTLFSRKTLGAMLEKAGLEPVVMTSPGNCWGALLSLRLTLGMGLRLDLSKRFVRRLAANLLTSPFDLVSHLAFGGEWITCYARKAAGF